MTMIKASSYLGWSRWWSRGRSKPRWLESRSLCWSLVSLLVKSELRGLDWSPPGLRSSEPTTVHHHCCCAPSSLPPQAKVTAALRTRETPSHFVERERESFALLCFCLVAIYAQTVVCFFRIYWYKWMLFFASGRDSLQLKPKMPMR